MSDSPRTRMEVEAAMREPSRPLDRRTGIATRHATTGKTRRVTAAQRPSARARTATSIRRRHPARAGATGVATPTSAWSTQERTAAEANATALAFIEGKQRELREGLAERISDQDPGYADAFVQCLGRLAAAVRTELHAHEASAR